MILVIENESMTGQFPGAMISDNAICASFEREATSVVSLVVQEIELDAMELEDGLAEEQPIVDDIVS